MTAAIENWVQRYPSPTQSLPITTIDDLRIARDWLRQHCPNATVLIDPCAGVLRAIEEHARFTVRLGQRLVWDINSRAFTVWDDADFRTAHRRMGFA